MNDGYVGGMKTQDVRLVYRRCKNTGCTTGMTTLTELQSVQRRDVGIPPYGYVTTKPHIFLQKPN